MDKVSSFSPGVGGMRTLLWLVVIGLCSAPVVTVGTAAAQPAPQYGPAATPLDPSQAMPVQLPTNGAYEQLRLPAPAGAADQVVPYSPACVVNSTCDDWTPFDSVYANGAWTFGVSIIPTEVHVTRGALGTWMDDDSAAVRWIIGWEGPEGVGLRGRGWAFGIETDTPSENDVKFMTAMFSLDLYKRLRGRQGELILGVGSTGGSLEFEFTGDRKTEFEGGGLGVFAEGRYTIRQYTRGDLGITGRGRYTIVRGDWHDRDQVLMPPTDHDMLSVFEASLGLEYRHLFGRCDNHYWYVGVNSEIQQWQSPWMTDYMATSIGFTGLSVDLGMVW